jgi:hypothetical protein
MQVYDFPFPIEIGSVCDLDFALDGAQVSIQGSSNHQFLIRGEEMRLALPDGWSSPDFPFIRQLTDGKILIVDTSFELAKQKNAWILDSNANIIAHFEIGSAAIEIVAVWGLIAVAYHPVFAKANGHQIQPCQRMAIAFFDYTGRLISGFNFESAHFGVHAENIRCMTALSRSQIIFVPEKLTVSGNAFVNPVVIFDCAKRRPRVFTAPFPLAEAISMSDGLIHIASPLDMEDQIITFDPEKKISENRGEFLGIFRGLEDGAFLAQTSSADYAVIAPGIPDYASPIYDMASEKELLVPV